MGTLRRTRCYAVCVGAGLAALLSFQTAARTEPLEVQDTQADATIDFSPLLSTPSPADRKPLTLEKLASSPGTGWDGKAGIDYRAIVAPELRADQPLPGPAQDQSAGVAWATVTVPGFSPGIDKVAVETRVDPAQEQGKLATKFSHSMPVAEGVSLTLQNAYSIMQTLPGGGAGLPLTGAKPGAPTPSQVRGLEPTARISFAPTDTTLSFGATMTNVDEKWHRSLSAEQKLFGGPISVTGSLSETDTGGIAKSLKAGVKRTW